MQKILPAFSLAVTLASQAAAQEVYPTEMSHSYNGHSFEVNVLCAEQAVRDFMGEGLNDFSSDVGVITARTLDQTAIVILSGERAESDSAHVEGVVVNNGTTMSSINHSGLQGSFISNSFLRRRWLLRRNMMPKA